jgi:hypothetical protein|tara:strand:+ start:3316 stop:3639 length:324 start_codon:yes stop_codon:yes gene_type:complete
MKKLISSFLILAFTLPLMAQEVEIKEEDGKTEVTIKEERKHDKKDWNRGDIRRNRMVMAKRKEMAKRQKIRSVVRLVVVGSLAYYIGYHQGEKHFKPGGWNRKHRDK